MGRAAIARVEGIAWHTADRWLTKASTLAERFNDRHLQGIDLERALKPHYYANVINGSMARLTTNTFWKIGMPMMLSTTRANSAMLPYRSLK